MNFEVYWEDEYVGRYVNGQCVEQVYHNSKLDVILRYPAEKLLARRVLPEVRWDQEVQEFYGLQDWDPLAICRLTHGYMMADFMWFKFPEDPVDLNWERVKLQLW